MNTKRKPIAHAIKASLTGQDLFGRMTTPPGKATGLGQTVRAYKRGKPIMQTHKVYRKQWRDKNKYSPNQPGKK